MSVERLGLAVCTHVCVCVELSAAAAALPRQHRDDAPVAMEVDSEEEDVGDVSYSST